VTNSDGLSRGPHKKQTVNSAMHFGKNANSRGQYDLKMKHTKTQKHNNNNTTTTTTKTERISIQRLTSLDRTMLRTSSKDISMMTLPKSSNQDQTGASSHQGTPNDVRLLFPLLKRERRESCPTNSSSVTSSSMSSPSIPIALVELSESEMQLEDDEAKAQFREHAMYQRIFYSMRESKSNKTAPGCVPNQQEAAASSLPFFPVLPHAISLHNQATHVYQQHHYETTTLLVPKVQPLPSAAVLPIDPPPTWQQHQQGSMIGREFSFANNSNNNHSHNVLPTDDDEDFVFEMDDM
jgi:type VI protein secretion system component VasA